MNGCVDVVGALKGGTVNDEREPSGLVIGYAGRQDPGANIGRTNNSPWS